MKKLINLLVASVIGSGLTIGVFLLTGLNHQNSTAFITRDPVAVHNAVYAVKENGKLVPLDFTGVSKEVMNSVVHITSTRKVQAPSGEYDNSPFGDMFGDQFFKFFYGEPPARQQKPQSYNQVGSGSGVIISKNGYIVTNNHVIDGANDIEVTLYDNDTYKAKVIGADPSTDVALLQIKADNLQPMALGNSDNVEVGEWVMAIGNPFNLNSTVTAGIISAKGRDINIIDDKSAIEAFIQTDAAINPGNSGGALLDLNGDLIGINTAIASPTGSYAGYGFAIPANIVSKVVQDFLKYGRVERAYLGIMIRDINSDLMKKENLKVSEGAYVDSITANSAAGEAGIKPGDVVTKVDNTPILHSSELLEQIGRHRPGDEVNVTVNRDGKELQYDVTLANQKGATKLLAKQKQDILDILGATLEPVDPKTAEKLDIDGGVQITELHSGLLKNQTNISKGFIITGINHKEVKSIDDVRKALKDSEGGGVLLQGIYENYPGELFFAFGMPEK